VIRDSFQSLFVVLLSFLFLACSDKHWLDLDGYDVVFVFENVTPDERRLLEAIMFSAVRGKGDELEIRSSKLEQNRLAFAYRSGFVTKLEKDQKIKDIRRMLKDSAPDCNYKLIHSN
jgi:hypothetical protein